MSFGNPKVAYPGCRAGFFGRRQI